MTNNEGQPYESGQEEDTQPARSERERQALQPRIYAASLADYNGGRLHGAWLDADRAPDEMQSGIDQMLAASPIPGAEEWAIHDYEGFGGIVISEYEDLTALCQLAQGLARHGQAFASWVQVAGRYPDLLRDFEDAYLGNHDSLAAYAEELLDSLGVTAEFDRFVADHLGEHLQAYVHWDFEALGRDLDLGGDIRSHERDDGSVDIFEGDSR